MKKLEPRYLGDGVYAEYNGYALIIRTGSHLHDEADNTIEFDPHLMKSLDEMLVEIKELCAAQKERQS